MAIDTGHNTRTTAAEYIPKLWSNEVIASYKKNVVLRNLIKAIPFKGKKGDTLYVPTFTRQTPTKKAANATVTLVAPTDTYVTVTVATHYEYSTLIEDIVEVQALSSLRQQYTDDAGYALAKQVDQDLQVLGAGFQGGLTDTAGHLYIKGVIGSDGSTVYNPAANTNTGNGTDLTDAGIRKMIQTLDDSDVPMDGRALVIPPVQRKVMLGIGRFTEQAFKGDGETLKTGMFGQIYGTPVYISTNCPFIHCNSVTGTSSVTFSSTKPTGAAFSDVFALTVDWNTSSPTDTTYRACLLLHRDSMCLAEQMAVRSQTQYKQEYLGDLFTADTIYGTAELRDYGAVAAVVPA